MNSKFWMTFVVRIDLVQYMLGLSGNFNPRLVSLKYLRYIFVSLCSDNSLHLNPRLAIPKLQCARKLPPPVKSRHAKCLWYPWIERTTSNWCGCFRNLPHISDKPNVYCTKSMRTTNVIQNFEFMLCSIKIFRYVYNACNLLLKWMYQCIPNVYTTASIWTKFEFVSLFE